MYLGRMHLLLQRLKRNRNFSRPAFAGIKASSRDYVEASAACSATDRIQWDRGCLPLFAMR